MLAAAAEGLALNDLADITALSPAALQKQWEFLRQHQFLKPNPDAPDQCPQLSERGSRLHQIAQLLQRAEQFIWLDAFTQGSQSGCWLTSASAPPSPQRHVWKLPVPARKRSLHEQCNRLRKWLDLRTQFELLRELWPDAKSSLLESEIDHWVWELKESKDEPCACVLLNLAANTSYLYPADESRSHPLPDIACPVLELTTRFVATPGYPWPVDVPEPVHYAMECFSLYHKGGAVGGVLAPLSFSCLRRFELQEGAWFAPI